MLARSDDAAISLEQVRKHARILVIDDHAFPAQRSFTRDGYHVERWAKIENLSQLTDGHYQLILLDVHGVGLNESLEKQGLGILEHIKKTNPAQAVILYSSKDYSVSTSRIIMQADAFLDKSSSYVDYKEAVDRLLNAQTTPGYFVARMNHQLGESAILVPKAVSLAVKAFRKKRPDTLASYLRSNLADSNVAETSLRIVSIGIQIIGLFAGQS